MGKKRMAEKTMKDQENDLQSPEWYWKRGLHDACILSLNQLTFEPDWKMRKPRFNCLEINLDAKNAIFETDIKKISLINYKIKTPEIDIDEIERSWWMWDTISYLPNDRYRLDIQIDVGSREQKQFAVEFESAEIESK